jgi:chromosome segregation ATPase
MNDVKKAVYIFVCAALFVAGIFAFAICLGQRSDIKKYKSDIQRLECELGQYRTRIDNLEKSEREFARTIDEAKDIIDGANASISSIGSSTQSIRAGLAELQEYIEELEDCLFGNGNNERGDNSGNSGD